MRLIMLNNSYILIGLLEKLYTHLYGGIKKFKEEGVKDMIAEKLILETDILIYEYEKREEKKALEIALEIAKNMLDEGMTVEQTAKLTKLPLSYIVDLQTKQ